MAPEFGVIGVGVAEAKSYYTRKRINGVWVKGKFPKRGVLTASRAATANAERLSKTAALPATTGSLSAASEFVMVPAPAALPSAAAQAGPSPQKTWPMPSAAAAHPSAPVQQGSIIVQSSATPGALAPQTVLTSPGLPVARAPAPTAPGLHEPPLVSPSDEQRLSKLREALQARASSLANGGGSGTGLAVRPIPEPQSVTFDFKSGVKTTIFADGTIVEDTFDVAAVRGMASIPPPASGSGLR